MNANGCTADSQGSEEDSSHTACNSSAHAGVQHQDMPLWIQDWIHISKKQKIDDYAQAHKASEQSQLQKEIAEMSAGAPFLAGSHLGTPVSAAATVTDAAGCFAALPCEKEDDHS